jgi:hypothetical protein
VEPNRTVSEERGAFLTRALARCADQYRRSRAVLAKASASFSARAVACSFLEPCEGFLNLNEPLRRHEIGVSRNRSVHEADGNAFSI